MVRFIVIITTVLCIASCSVFYWEWDKGNSPPKARAKGAIEGCRWSADGDILDMELEEITYKCEWNNEQINEWLRKL